jgi:hypothetical protein
MELDVREAVVNEKIYIPQHAGGRAKEIGLVDTSETGGECRVKAIDDGSCSSGGMYDDVRYSCDTEGGSSGAPVLARSTNKVIALHHCDGACDGNMGAPISKIYDHVRPYLYPDPVDCGDDHLFQMTLTTDEYGFEFSYQLTDVSGIEIASGTGFDQSRPYEIVRCLTGGTYTLTVFDSGGDGLCCGYGEGSYEVALDGNVIKSGASFGASESVTFITLAEVKNTPCINNSKWKFRGRNGKTKKCGWVAKNPGRRCKKVGEDSTTGFESCPKACGCPP